MQRQFKPDEINEIAHLILDRIGKRSVIAFHGLPGAGKTTLIQALCSLKGVKDQVTSPTFSIINKYKAGEEIIYHIDLYRLKNSKEAADAGIEECLTGGKICFIEWPDIAALLIPEDALHVYLEVVDTNSRLISFK